MTRFSFRTVLDASRWLTCDAGLPLPAGWGKLVTPDLMRRMPSGRGFALTARRGAYCTPACLSFAQDLRQSRSTAQWAVSHGVGTIAVTWFEKALCAPLPSTDV